VPVNLFACLVGRSGAKKSPIGRLLVEAPTAELRGDLARANQRDREAWGEACRELKKGEPRPPAPQPKRLAVSDFTGEALAAQLQTQEAAGLGLLVNRDELSGLFGSLNAYRGGRGADEQQLLELFDGSGLSSLRIVGDRHYSRSQLSIWGSTQPDVLRQLVADGDASGLWARFLFVPLPERAVPLPLATSAAEVAEVEAAAQTLADACGAVYRLPPQTYRLAPAAAERFAHYELNRQRAALGASIGAQSALYGKSAGKVLRLAGVLHLLQIAAGEISNRDPIEPGTIERAAALVDHLDAWALGLHAEVAAGGVGGLMRTVHRAAEAAGGPIRWKEVQNRLTRAQRKETDPAAVAEAMRALAAAGYGEVEAGKRGALSYRAARPLPGR
jgi:CRISPR-associated protein Cmr3